MSNVRPNYVFFGSPKFAVAVLKPLIDAGMEPAALVANPARPKGRKKILTEPLTKQFIKDLNLPVVVYQPENPKDIVVALTELKPDFFVVAAYAKIIPKEVLVLARLGAIGIHPSLLPKYRGASPIQSALLAGEEDSGVTAYLLDEKMDNGPILDRRGAKVKDLNYEEAEEKLGTLGGEMLVALVPKFMTGELMAEPQDSAAATFTKKFTAEDGFIDMEKSTAEEILRKIRALNPEPGAWTVEKGKRMKLLDAEINDGHLQLKKIQLEGKKPRLL